MTSYMASMDALFPLCQRSLSRRAMRGMKGSMLRLALSRLVSAVPTLLAVVLFSFILMRYAPGSPFDGERALDPQLRAALEAKYGLDDPLPVQVFRYVGGLLRGDFGPSLVYPDFTVNQLIAQGLPVSLRLGALALMAALVGGILIGVWAAVRAGGWLDRLLMIKATLLTAIPTFVTGPVLVLLFGLTLGWLPLSGLGAEDAGWGTRAAHLLLPVIALALPFIGAIAKLTRAGLAAQLDSDYVRAARGRGLSPFRVLTRHALRPALVPVASYLGPAAAGLLTGAVVIETVFALPGLGRYFVQGALNRDYPLVLGVVTLYAALIILFNLVADLLYGWLDPRMRER